MIVREIAGGSHGDRRPNIDHLSDFHTEKCGGGYANDVENMITKLKLASNRALALIKSALP